MQTFFLASIAINIIIMIVMTFDLLNYLKSIDDNLSKLNKDVKETIEDMQNKNIEILNQLKQNIGE